MKQSSATLTAVSRLSLRLCLRPSSPYRCVQIYTSPRLSPASISRSSLIALSIAYIHFCLSARCLGRSARAMPPRAEGSDIPVPLTPDSSCGFVPLNMSSTYSASSFLYFAYPYSRRLTSASRSRCVISSLPPPVSHISSLRPHRLRSPSRYIRASLSSLRCNG